MATGQSKLLPEEADPVWVAHEGRLRQTMSVGIRKRKTKKAGYAVEFRLSKSPTKELAKEKIWAGTFESRPKAMRAFDVARHLAGMEPFYYEYPEGYLPTRPSQMPTEAAVKCLAMQYAEMPDELAVNPSSLFSDSSTSAPAVPPIVGVGSHQPTTMPRQREASIEVLEANEELKDVEAKVEPAYIRGLHAPNTSAVTDLLEQPSPEFLNVYPHFFKGRGQILDVIEKTPLELLDLYDGSSDPLFRTMPENHFVRELPVGSDAFVTAEEWKRLL